MSCFVGKRLPTPIHCSCMHKLHFIRNLLHLSGIDTYCLLHPCGPVMDEFPVCARPSARMVKSSTVLVPGPCSHMNQSAKVFLRPPFRTVPHCAPGKHCPTHSSRHRDGKGSFTYTAMIRHHLFNCYRCTFCRGCPISYTATHEGRCSGTSPVLPCLTFLTSCRQS